MPYRSGPTAPETEAPIIEGDVDIRPVLFLLWLVSAAACIASIALDGEMGSEGTLAAMCVIALPFAMRK